MEEGKTLPETRIEVQVAANLFEFMAKNAWVLWPRWRPAGRRSLVISASRSGRSPPSAPWNFPITNPARKLGGPLAAGCSVILKPAEEPPARPWRCCAVCSTPVCRMGVRADRLGVPDEVSSYLLSSPVIRSCRSPPDRRRQAPMKLAADNMLRTTMELGGHAPVLIFDDADLEKALDELTAAKLRNAGQVCISPTRFYVQEGVYDPRERPDRAAGEGRGR